MLTKHPLGITQQLGATRGHGEPAMGDQGCLAQKTSPRVPGEGAPTGDPSQ